VGQRFSGRKNKLALAKRSSIASTPYAIPSEVYLPFTLSGNFMVIREKLQPESWVKDFQGRKKNWRSRSTLRLLVLHIQSQARSTHPLPCLEISWLYVENCDQNRGSKVFREEKNWRSRSALWLLVLHMQSQARSTYPLHCLEISWLYVKNCDQNRGSKIFREEKKIGAREALFDC